MEAHQCKTVLVPGYWWHSPDAKPTRKVGRNTKESVLKCVRDNPGITSNEVPQLTNTTLHYAREVLRALVREGVLTKRYEGNSVVSYWSAV